MWMTLVFLFESPLCVDDGYETTFGKRSMKPHKRERQIQQVRCGIILKMEVSLAVLLQRCHESYMRS